MSMLELEKNNNMEKIDENVCRVRIVLLYYMVGGFYGLGIIEKIYS